MTLIQDQLRNAKFRGVDCLVKNSRITFGQKTIIHRYPNSDRVEVEYLGADTEDFALEMIIKGSGDDYFTKRNAFKKALSEPSNAILLHPYEGEILCSVVPKPQIDERDAEQGKAIFIVNFIKVDDKIFPTKTTDNRGLIESIRLAVQNANVAYIEDTFGLTYSATYQAAKGDLENLNTLYTNTTNAVTVSDDKISTVKNTIRTYNNSILGYLSGDDILSTGLTDLYNSLTGIGETSTDQLNLWYDLFDSVPDNPIYTTSTARRIEELNNTDVIYTTTKTQTLANIYNYTPNISFASVDEIDAYREQIETRYQEIVQVDTSIPSTSLSKTGLNNPDVAYNLSLLRSQVQLYLDNLENTVGEVVTIENVQSTTLTEFVFSQYGNLDNYTEVKELNDIQDPTNIKGSIQIIV